MVLGKSESHMQKHETRLEFVPVYKSESKMIKDLNKRSETINYMEENIETKLMNLGLREDFMNLTPKTMEKR